MEQESPEQVISLEEHLKLADEYDRLRKIYERTKTKYAECKAHRDEAIAKYRSARNVAEDWHRWYERHQEAIDAFIEARKAAKLAATASELDERNVTSSQTTEGEQAFVRQDDVAFQSSDQPEVVSVRSLKRKRSKSLGSVQDHVRIKIEPTSPTTPIELGSEDYSSPVLTRSKPVRAETSDLDAHVEHADTPRKRKIPRAQSEEAPRPTSLLPATSSLSEGNILDVDDDAAYIKAEAMVPTHTDNAITAQHSVARDKAGNHSSNVLRQRSVNIQSMSKSANIRPILQRKRKPELDSLAEDGDDQMSQNAKLKNQPHGWIGGQDRLDSLLDIPSPSKQLLTSRATPAKTLHQPVKTKPAVVKREATSEELPTTPLTAFKRPKGLERSPSPPRPEEEPLRARPLKMLSLDDFKINPNYLGSKYAFADTFRGREQRRCLPGCTRPDCCGNSFQKAVETGMILSAKTDDQVLQEYLGSDWATHMYAYGPDKRKELIVQARAYAFANQHGKHRDAFARRSTPPGYWRIDMPSTQEEEQDRARAIDLEREKVEDRWREAMRGGSWIFKDEL